MRKTMTLVALLAISLAAVSPVAVAQAIQTIDQSEVASPAEQGFEVA